MQKHAWNLAVPIVFIVIVTLYLIDIRNIRGIESYYPLSVAIIAGVLAVVSMWRDRLSLVPTSASSSEASQVGPPDSSEMEGAVAGTRVKNVLGNPAVITLALMGIVAVAIYLMTWLGFFVPSVIMVAAAAALLGIRVWWKLVVYPIAVVGLAYLLFVETLNVPFPSGPWG